MRFIVVAILILLPVTVFAEITGKPRVIDGDTIEIAGQRILLHGIDAPETDQTCGRNSETWRCGQQAALALADKIGQRSVRCEEQDRDRRIVAKCFVGGEDLSEWLAREGWASLTSTSATSTPARRHGPSRAVVASGRVSSKCRGTGERRGGSDDLESGNLSSCPSRALFVLSLSRSLNGLAALGDERDTPYILG